MGGLMTAYNNILLKIGFFPVDKLDKAMLL